MCVSHVAALAHIPDYRGLRSGVAIQDLIHQGLYLSHMGHSGGRVKAVCMGLAAGNEPYSNPQVYRSAELRDKSWSRQAEINVLMK